MAEQEKRTYLGHGKRVKDYDLVNFSVCVSDIPTSSIFEYKGKKYVKLVIGAKREPNEHGKTHSVWLDTFKPDKTKRQSPGDENPQPRRSSEELSVEYPDGVDDIPF